MKKIIVLQLTVLLSVFFLSVTAHSKILGCYQKEHGQLRVVSDFSQCLASEEPITLDQGSISSGEYHGEVCFGMSDYEGTPMRFKIGKFLLGDTYYSLSGVQYDESGGQDVLSGSAVMIDNHLQMVFTIVRHYTKGDDGELLESQLGQIKWNEADQKYNLMIIDTKQYVDDPADEHIGDDYSNLIEIDCQ